MTSYTASAARIGDHVIDHACQEDAPAVVQDLCTLLADVMVEHPDVQALVVSVEVTR